VDSITTVVEPEIILTTLSSYICLEVPKTVTTTITYVPTLVTQAILTTSCFTGQIAATAVVGKSSTVFDQYGGISVTLTSYSTFQTFGTSCTSYVTTITSALPAPSTG
jgi:hypothetical protein